MKEIEFFLHCIYIKETIKEFIPNDVINDFFMLITEENYEDITSIDRIGHYYCIKPCKVIMEFYELTHNNYKKLRS